MPPTVIRSLGATAPSRPSAELGIIVGAITAACAPAADVRYTTSAGLNATTARSLTYFRYRTR